MRKELIYILKNKLVFDSQNLEKVKHHTTGELLYNPWFN